MIAGSTDLSTVMGALADARPVFHSESDFQHAFGQAVHDLDRSLHVRLEVRQDGPEYLDLLCFGSNGRTAIEFKYFTSSWVGSDPRTDEKFRLKSHAATDLARRNFVFDIARLERFCRNSERTTNGLAVLLTNCRNLWEEPKAGRVTRDAEFRIHSGSRLTGTLRWGKGAYLANQRTLTGDYRLEWKDFSVLGGVTGALRWLGVEVSPAAFG